MTNDSFHHAHVEVYRLTYFGTNHFWSFHKTWQREFCTTSLCTFESNCSQTL